MAGHGMGHCSRSCASRSPELRPKCFFGTANSLMKFSLSHSLSLAPPGPSRFPHTQRVWRGRAGRKLAKARLGEMVRQQLKEIRRQLKVRQARNQPSPRIMRNAHLFLSYLCPVCPHFQTLPFVLDVVVAVEDRRKSKPAGALQRESLRTGTNGVWNVGYHNP